ncbi:MAG: thioesterase family protein [bacterium]|nr:thioesterase family protein [bacterium]
MAGQKFEYPVFVSIGDTNMEQNVYWTRYVDWFAKAREVFLMSIFPDFLKIFASGSRIMTHETNLKHMSSAFFAEEVTLEITMGEVRRTSAKMFATFIKKGSGEKIAELWQTLVFADNQGKPVPIPQALREAVLKYVAE